MLVEQKMRFHFRFLRKTFGNLLIMLLMFSCIKLIVELSYLDNMIGI